MYLRNCLLSIWKHLPVNLRQKVANAVFEQLAPKLSDISHDEVVDKDIPKIIVGFLSSPSGLGQSARLTAQAFAQSEYTVYGIDLSSYFYEVAGAIAHGVPGGWKVLGKAHVIININASYLPYVLFLLGRSFLKNKYITGYWAWELPQLPTSWKRGYACVHDVIVPSSFVAKAVWDLDQNKSVTVAPHPAALDYPQISNERSVNTPFTVINTMSVSSGFERKNPLALIAAFRLAFGDATDCSLRMLITNTDHYSPAHQAIKAATEGVQNIEITWQGMDRDGLWHWWGTPDIYASLHRSEGFGLSLAEAMCAGVPVVATGWSGNMEFMNRENSFPIRYDLTDVEDKQLKYDDGMGQWASPDVDHAAQIFRQLKEKPELAAKIARKAKEEMMAALSPSSFVERLCKRNDC